MSQLLTHMTITVSAAAMLATAMLGVHQQCMQINNAQHCIVGVYGDHYHQYVLMYCVYTHEACLLVTEA
jgi:hypothetical protein